MKKWYQTLKNKQHLKLILLTLTLVLVTVGSTYAWWTASTTVDQQVTMGNLKIEARFDQDTLTNYEPGTYGEINGTIKNSGSIPAIVKIDNGSTITYAYSDDALTPIAVGDRQAEAVDPTAVKISYEPENGDYLANDQVIWFTHADGHKYLLMEPKATLKVSIQLAFDGASASNKYMDALVEAKAQLKATQVIEGAISSEFGIDASELIDLPATRTFSKSHSRLDELLNRGK